MGSCNLLYLSLYTGGSRCGFSIVPSEKQEYVAYKISSFEKILKISSVINFFLIVTCFPTPFNHEKYTSLLQYPPFILGAFFSGNDVTLAHS